jgi:serine protease Do
MRVENITRQLQGYFELEDETGVVVTKVVPDSPADKAKVTPGTVIMEMNRKPVPDMKAYQKILRNSNSRDTLLLLVKQGSRTHYLTITVP